MSSFVDVLVTVRLFVLQVLNRKQQQDSSLVAFFYKKQPYFCLNIPDFHKSL